MEIFNYIAGSTFPPTIDSMRWKESYRHRKSFHPKIVIFVLSKESDISYQCCRLAECLLHDIDIQGFVYSFFPENRDFFKCARFFRTSDYPAYIIIPFPIFLLMSILNDPFGIFDEYFHYFDEYCHYHDYGHFKDLLLRVKRENGYWIDFFEYDEFHRGYRIINNIELSKSSSKEQLAHIINSAHDIASPYVVMRWLSYVEQRYHRSQEDQHRACSVVHNYIAGSSFPPTLTNNLNFKIVIFALKTSQTLANRLAENLSETPNFQGIVYHLDSENCDFFKCADFFNITHYPVYIAIPHKEFYELLKGVSHKLSYAVLDMENPVPTKAVIEQFQKFYNDGMPCTLSIQNRSIFQETKPLEHSTEIIILFNTSRSNASDFDVLLYDVFMKFGALTDNVLVRILHPSFISNEYQDIVRKYEIISLPCAIFIHRKTEEVIIKMERDIFEAIPDLTADKLKNLVSDIHNAISVDKLELVQQRVEQAINPADKTMWVMSNDKAEGKFFIIKPKTVVIGNVGGNIIGGDNIGGDKTTERSNSYNYFLRLLKRFW